MPLHVIVPRFHYTRSRNQAIQTEESTSTRLIACAGPKDQERDLFYRGTFSGRRFFRVETGLEFRIIKSLYFLSSFAIQWSHIKVPSGYFPSFINDGKAWDNTLYSFGFGGSYYIPIKDTYVYLSFTILNSLSNFGGSDSDLKRDFEYKPKGSGLKFSLGLAAPTGKKSKAVIELGYKNLPVTINVWDPEEYISKSETKNFGGIFLNACFSFGLITF